MNFFDRVTNLLSIILENSEKNKELKESNERYKYINKVTDDAIYDWNIENDVFYWSESFKTNFGYDLENKIFRLNDWINLMNPIDVEFGKERWDNFFKDKKQSTWKNNFKFKKANGKYADVEEIAYVIRDKKGNPSRMIGVLRDETQKVELENNRKILFDVNNIFNSNESLSIILNKSLKFLTEITNSKLAEIWLINKSKDKINLYAHFAIDSKTEMFYDLKKIF